MYVLKFSVEEVGCYRDYNYARTFPDLYASLRGRIDWFNMRATVKDCAKLAHKKHYKVSKPFHGLQLITTSTTSMSLTL